MVEYKSSDFLKAFADRRGYTIEKGDKAIVLLMPWVMMNVAYEYYCRDILPLKLTQKTKLYRKQWKEAYDKFNSWLFDCFDNDMQDAFCDKMDEFKKFMYQDIVQLQSKMIRCLPQNASAENKQIVSAALLSNRIARVSYDMFSACYSGVVKRTLTINNKKDCVKSIHPATNSGLAGVLSYTTAFAREFVKNDNNYSTEVSVEAQEDMYKSLDSFRVRCFKFIDFDIRKEEE